MSQLEAMNGKLEEAGGSRGAGVFLAWESEVKVLQLRQGHGKLGDVVIF